MSMEQKLTFIHDYVVYSCYCIWELFKENVESYGAADFRAKLRKATTETELKKLVHEYI